MNNGGFIKLYRKIVDWEWYDDINTKTVFFHLLLTANYENKRWRGIELEAGSRIVSLHGLSDETGLSIWQVRRALSNLENTNEIIKQTTNRYTVVKLAKWADYQCNTTSKPQTNHKQTATDKEVKKERSKDIPPLIPPRGKSSPAVDYASLVAELTQSENVREAALGWIDMRVGKGKRFAPTERAVRLAFRQIRDWGCDEKQAVECFNRSTVGNYQGVFKSD